MMKLVLIHTGGTIGMAETPGGLAPKPGLVEDAIKARLHEGVELVEHVFDPLVDSADVGPDDWNHILDLIDAEPDAPVILTHGTDTMAFTGAALSQALFGLGRRVVMCGSMLPLGMDGDAEGNLDLALQAVMEPGEGVFLAFADQIMPAAGLVKHNSHMVDAFRSVPQALSEPAVRRFEPRKLAILTLSPALPVEVLTAALSALDGAVLRVFGSGTMMNNPDLIAALRAATDSGTPIRCVSQCESGGLEPRTYAAGAGLWSAGVENGGNQTAEAALVSLWLRK